MCVCVCACMTNVFVVFCFFSFLLSQISLPTNDEMVHSQSAAIKQQADDGDEKESALPIEVAKE